MMITRRLLDTEGAEFVMRGCNDHRRTHAACNTPIQTSFPAIAHVIDTIVYTCFLALLPPERWLKGWRGWRPEREDDRPFHSYERSIKHSLLGIRIFIREGIVVKVEVDLPKLLYGHNGRLITTQAQLDHAFARLKQALQTVCIQPPTRTTNPDTNNNAMNRKPRTCSTNAAGDPSVINPAAPHEKCKNSVSSAQLASTLRAVPVLSPLRLCWRTAWFTAQIPFERTAPHDYRIRACASGVPACAIEFADATTTFTVISGNSTLITTQTIARILDAIDGEMPEAFRRSDPALKARIQRLVVSFIEACVDEEMRGGYESIHHLTAHIHIALQALQQLFVVRDAGCDEDMAKGPEIQHRRTEPRPGQRHPRRGKRAGYPSEMTGGS